MTRPGEPFSVAGFDNPKQYTRVFVLAESAECAAEVTIFACSGPHALARCTKLQDKLNKEVAKA